MMVSQLSNALVEMSSKSEENKTQSQDGNPDAPANDATTDGDSTTSAAVQEAPGISPEAIRVVKEEVERRRPTSRPARSALPLVSPPPPRS